MEDPIHRLPAAATRIPRFLPCGDWALFLPIEFFDNPPGQFSSHSLKPLQLGKADEDDEEYSKAISSHPSGNSSTQGNTPAPSARQRIPPVIASMAASELMPADRI